jgi:CRP-like cAMP-binding protein
VLDAERLGKIRVFESLTIAERNMLARILDEFTVAPGATIVQQGDFGYEFMVIEEGTVQVVLDGAPTDEMGPGDFFGELAVLADGAQRNATIVATSPVRGLKLTARDMRTVRERMPKIGEQIDRVIADRIH